jgi:hypothetical protein
MPRGRPLGSRNKKVTQREKASKDLLRKRRQRKLEKAVELHEFLTAEAEQARALNPDPGSAPFFYSGTQAKILGKPFERTAARINRKRTAAQINRKRTE